MDLATPGVPPASIGAFIEDMLAQLAELADGLGDDDLAVSIRVARQIAARANAESQGPSDPTSRRQDD